MALFEKAYHALAPPTDSSLVFALFDPGVKQWKELIFIMVTWS